MQQAAAAPPVLPLLALLPVAAAQPHLAAGMWAVLVLPAVWVMLLLRQRQRPAVIGLQQLVKLVWLLVLLLLMMVVRSQHVALVHLLLR